MVSHTTRLVCYAIPRCPGPSHPDTIIIIIIIIIIITIIARFVRCLSTPLPKLLAKLL